jgi:CMP-N,N'-diacetyllegionaminic acid synthase
MARFIGFIPARAGSKGIPRKNLYEISGFPLIDYTINCAVNSSALSEIYLSTDDIAISMRAEGTRIKVPSLRPEHLATDTALTVDVIKHAINFWVKDYFDDDYLVLLQPTSPLREPHHIAEACSAITKSNLDGASLVSVCDVGAIHPARMKIIDKNGLLKNLSGLEFEDMRPRQQLPTIYIRNGAIYINRIIDIMENNRILSPNCIPYVMTKDESINIDTIDDVSLAESKLQSKI